MLKSLGIFAAFLVCAWLWIQGPQLGPTGNLKTIEPGDQFGQILEISGNVLTKASDQSYFYKAEKGSSLHPVQHLLTGVDGKALLKVDGGQFELAANSRIKINKKQDSIEVHLLDGQLRRLNKNGNVKFFVNSLVETDLVLTQKPRAPLAELPKVSEIQKVPETTPKTKSIVDEEQILENVRFSQSFFEKCFISHYQRVSGDTKGGRIVVEYKVDVSGRVRSPEVKSSHYQDDVFHECLVEVFRRIRIKNYKGPEVRLEFPIDINLPED